MKKIILAFMPFILLAGCGTKTKDDTSNFAQVSPEPSSSSAISPSTAPSSTSKSSPSSIEEKSYPVSLEKFLKGDYSTFYGAYKSSTGEKLIITPNNIEYYSNEEKDVGPVIINESTFKSKTDTPPFTQIYQFNKGQVEINFNEAASKIEEIRITDSSAAPTTFTFAARLDTRNFTEETALNYLKSYFADPDILYGAQKQDNSVIIDIHIKKWVENGGSGTAGIYQVLPDGTFYLVHYDTTTNTYIPYNYN